MPPVVEPRPFGNPQRVSSVIPQPEPELRLVPARIVRHTVDVRAQEGQEGDAEGLEVGHRAGVVLILDKRVRGILNGPAPEPGADQADGVAAGGNEGIERAEGVIVAREDKLGDVVVHHRDGGHRKGRCPPL